MSYAQEIEEAAGGAENIIGVVIGKLGYYQDKDEKGVPEHQRDRVLKWNTARPLLDYTYDAGYGGEDCNPVHVWTKDKVIFSVCYDGSTWLGSVPRKPTAPPVPSFQGGG